MALLTSANTWSASMSWCTQLTFASPLPWSSQVFSTSWRPCTPPCALVHRTNAWMPYSGPTNARGSNGLVLLAIVPIVIVVAVTPASDATLLLLPPPPAGPPPGPLSPPAPVDGPVPGLLLRPPTSPPGAVLTPGSGSPD